MKLNKMREQMANAFISALKEDKIPWRKEWTSAQFCPINAVTHSKYRAGNSLWLSYQMMTKGFSDPRWCTFNQATEKGWKIKKGSKGSMIEFWSLYDKKEKKTITFGEAEQIKKDDENWPDRIRPMSKTFTVFNAEQIDGIPELKIEKHELNLESFLQKRDVLLKNMEVALSEGHNGASYSVSEDLIRMPNVNDFESEYGYISTFLHEASHSTGHEKRLNRPLKNAFGTPDYAKEELRAEISSAFTSQFLGIENVDNSHLENHKAYIQNWISVLEKNPEELFSAIKDAEKISDYLIEKGEFEPTYEIIYEEEIKQEKPVNNNKDVSKKKFYSNEESIEMSAWLKRNIKITDVCESLGYNISKVGRSHYTLKEHDSVRLDINKNCFFWNSTGEKGSVIDACMSLGKMDKAEAYNHLYSLAGGQEQVYESIYGSIDNISIQKTPVKAVINETADDVKEQKKIQLPVKADNIKNVYAYLSKTRNISTNVINEFIEKEMLYQDNHNNCVFVSKNDQGEPTFACVRGTNTYKRFIADCPGIDYSNGFYIDNGADKVFVAESVIDIMSKMSLLELNGENYHQYNYLALSGTQKQEPILTVLNDNSNIKEVVLGLDNDAGGIAATLQIEDMLKDKDVLMNNDSPSETGYDWNDVLKQEKENNLWDLKKNENPLKMNFHDIEIER